MCVHREVARLAQAIAERGTLAPLLEALHARRSRETKIRRTLSQLQASRAALPETSEVGIVCLRSSDDPRRILHDRAHAQDAQRLPGRRLTVGRLTLFPLPDQTGYRFTM